jgi:hypothetical protein
MIDASPSTSLNNIHYYVLKTMRVHCHGHRRTIWRATQQNNAIFSYQGFLTSLEAPQHQPNGLHCRILGGLQFPLTKISCRSHPTSTIHKDIFIMWYRITGANSTKFATLLRLGVLWCQISTEANSDSPKTQTGGDIWIDGIMELDPGPMTNNDHSNRDDPKNCDTGTTCLLPCTFISCSIWPHDLRIPTGTSDIPSCQAQG